MGRKPHSKRRPQAPKSPAERERRAMMALAALPEISELKGLGSDKAPRTGNLVFGSGKKKGVIGGQRGAVRPPAVAHVGLAFDPSRARASHDGLTGVADPNPTGTTFLRNRKGGTGRAYQRPRAVRDACPDCGSTGTHAQGCAYAVPRELRTTEYETVRHPSRTNPAPDGRIVIQPDPEKRRVDLAGGLPDRDVPPVGEAMPADPARPRFKQRGSGVWVND